MTNDQPIETNTTSRGLNGGREYWQTTTPFDPLLDYTTIDGRHFFVRQMKNLKVSMTVRFVDSTSI